MSTLEPKFSFLKTIKLSSDIYSFCFNKYNSIAIGTSDKTVSVWEWTEEGFKEANYSPLLWHDYAVTSVVFSADGSALATSSTDGVTYMFNSKTGGQRSNIVQSIAGGVRQSSLTTTNKRVLATVTDEGYIFLWCFDSYLIQRYWLAHDSGISCLAFTPDGYLLSTADTCGTLKIWLVDRAVSTIHMVDTLCGHVEKNAHYGGILTVTFSPNHYTEIGTREYQMCSGGDDNLLKLWSVSVADLGTKECEDPKITVKLQKVLEGHESSVTFARYSPGGTFIGSTSLDCYARIWEVSSGVCIRILGGHKRSAFCCAFSPEMAFFASGSNDKTVSIWQINDDPIPVTIHTAPEVDDWLEQNAMQKRRFTPFHDAKLDSSVNCIDFNNNFDLVVGCSDKTVRIFGLKGLEYKEKYPKSILDDHKFPVVNAEYSKCGKYLVTSALDGTVICWKAEKYKKLCSPFRYNSEGGRTARFSPASDWLALGGHDGKAYLWSIKSKSVKFVYPGHSQPINCLAFSPDGEYLATGSSSGQVKLWKTNPPVSFCQLTLENVHDLGVMSCDFSNVFSKIKGTSFFTYRLATGGNEGLIKVFKLWPKDELNVRSEEEYCLKGHGGSIAEVRFSGKSSNVLASTATDRTTRVWNMQNGQCLNVLSHHKSQVTCCAFSSDFSLFATGSLDSSIVVWRIPGAISLCHKYETDDLSPPRVVNPGEPLDLVALRLDDVHLNLDDLVIAAKRNCVEFPEHFLCPITGQIMTEPVTSEDGFTYDKHAIENWMVTGRGTSPMTNVPLSSTVIVPNIYLTAEIKKFLVNHCDPESLNDDSPNMRLIRKKSK